MLLYIVSTYLIIGLLSNFHGPVSRRIKVEFAKTNLKMGMYSVGAPELYEKMKGQELPFKILFRLLVTAFWPVFYFIVGFDYWREKKRKEHNN